MEAPPETPPPKAPPKVKKAAPRKAKKAGHSRPADKKGYQEEFLALLNNKDKKRQNGFVVLARGGKNLKPLQSLCFESRQKWNKCLTARYRLQPGAIFGTLSAAFFFDLATIRYSSPEIQQHNKKSPLETSFPETSPRGDLSPEPPHQDWQRLIKSLPKNMPFLWPGEKSGKLGQGDLDRWLKVLAGEKILPIGVRLVLFAEVGGSREGQAEWEYALKTLSPKLPERLGIVISGAPEDFHLPDDNPSFLKIDLPEDSPDNDSAQPEEVAKYEASPLSSDLPARRDLLGVKSYAEALARLILHQQTQPPLTIGIYAPWGKGKSSFMELVDIALVKWASANRGTKKDKLSGLLKEIEKSQAEVAGAAGEEKECLQSGLNTQKGKHQQLWEEMQDAAKGDVLTVRFNAWRYQDAKQIWAGLASVISKRLEAELPSWWSHFLMRVDYAWQNHRSELILNLFLPVLVVFFAGIYLIDIISGSVALGAFLSVCFTAWRVLKVVQPMSERVLGYATLPNYREQMGYQHRVLEDLRFVYNQLQQHRKGCKVVVFIDDLDRCSEDKIMEILQAINLILGDDKFFVLLGMAPEIIQRAIRTYYSKNQQDKPSKEEFEEFEKFAENYLCKIVQLPFFLPAIPVDKRFAILSDVFSPAVQRELEAQADEGGKQEETVEATTDGGFSFNLELLEDPKLQLSDTVEVEDTVHELAAFRDYQEFLTDNPREIKRLANIHRLVKIMLQQPGVSWSPERQRKLVKWLIFCANWPEYIEDVLAIAEEDKECPNCLGKLTKKGKQLEEFASYKDKLSAQDIDDAFKLAAEISHMVCKPSVSSQGVKKP